MMPSAPAPPGARDPHRPRSRPLARLVVVAALAVLAAAAPPAAGDMPYPHVPCYTGHDVIAWARYPPSCPRGFTSHDRVTLIVNGLPAGSGIHGRLSFTGFTITSEAPGGTLGGEITLADATARFDMRGTGACAGYTRTLWVPVTMTLHTGPQVPGTPVRSFPVDVFRLFGQVVGDPDFALLRLVAGTNLGLPSLGHAALTRDETGDVLVDSFWDLTYRVDFVGDPGGPFAGLSGSTTSMHRQRAGMRTNPPSDVPDNGAGTADWTPFCGGWGTKTEMMLYDDGAGTFLVGNMQRTPPGGLGIAPGGPFGGEQTNDVEGLRLQVIGEGALAGFQRMVALPDQAQHDLGPVMTGEPFRGRISDPTFPFAQIGGDPDFDLPRVSGGTAFGFPTRGHTTLTRGPATASCPTTVRAPPRSRPSARSATGARGTSAA